jgi:hypothetical protein
MNKIKFVAHTILIRFQEFMAIFTLNKTSYMASSGAQFYVALRAQMRAGESM